jgi:hypothetical protein
MSIVNLNNPFDISQITIASGIHTVNNKKVDSYFSILLSGTQLYIQSPRGVCLSSIGDTVSVEFNADRCNTIVDWTRDIQNRCYYLARSHTDIPRQYCNTILEHNALNETAVLVASVGKQDNQVHELIVYDETKTLRSELDVVKDINAVFIFEIKGFFILDCKLQWHIVARQIMIIDPSPSPSTLQFPTESELIPELESELIPELKPLSSLQTLNIDDTKNVVEISPKLNDALEFEPDFLLNDEDNISEDIFLQQNTLTPTTSLSVLSLMPKRNVYNNMYKQAKKNVDFLKHQYDNALQILNEIKSEYEINDMDFDETNDN